jgi:hypothetical protein
LRSLHWAIGRDISPWDEVSTERFGFTAESSLPIEAVNADYQGGVRRRFRVWCGTWIPRFLIGQLGPLGLDSFEIDGTLFTVCNNVKLFNWISSSKTVLFSLSALAVLQKQEEIGRKRN